MSCFFLAISAFIPFHFGILELLSKTHHFPRLSNKIDTKQKSDQIISVISITQIMVHRKTIVSTLSQQNFKFYLVAMAETIGLIHLHPTGVNFHPFDASHFGNDTAILQLSYVIHRGWYMGLISLLPTIFQISPFFLGSFYLPSNDAVGGGCFHNLQSPKVMTNCS